MERRTRFSTVGGTAREEALEPHAQTFGFATPTRQCSLDLVQESTSADSGRALSVAGTRAVPAEVLRAQAHARALLSPAAVLEVDKLLRHDANDLNVSRVAVREGCSRWTLQRRMVHTGGCPKQLVALARILSVLGSFEQLGQCTPGSGRWTTRPLTRSERRAVRKWLGHSVESFAKLWHDGGLPAVWRIFSSRFSSRLLAREEPMQAYREAPPRLREARLTRELAGSRRWARIAVISRASCALAKAGVPSPPPFQSRSAGSPTFPRRSR